MAQDHGEAPMDEHTLETDLAKLEASLAEAASVYEKLLAATRSEAEILRSARVSELAALVNEKIRLASQAARLEAKRQRLAEEIARRLDLPPSSTLSQVIAALPEAAQAGLTRLGERLVAVIEELSLAGESNSRLAPNGVYITSNLIATLAPATFSSGAYSGGGRTLDCPPSSIVEIAG